MDSPNEIPIVDFESVKGDWGEVSKGPCFDKVMTEFGNAASSIGFCYIKNHGVDLDKIDRVYKLAKQFFDLPTKVKEKYKKPEPSVSYHGYMGPGDEFLNENEKNSVELRELWDVWGYDGDDEAKYPTEVPGMKACFDALRPELNNLIRKLLVCYAKYLKLEDEEFFIKTHTGLDGSRHHDSYSPFRALYYYPLDPNDKSIPPNAIRCGEHADWGTLTLLTQDMIGGLEVKKATGEWIQATPVKDAILVNNAQLLEFWSGGRFPAALHRVRIMDVERQKKTGRQSVIYFVSPDGCTEIEPLVPLREGYEHFAERPRVNSYKHYMRLMEYVSTKGSY